MKRIALLLLFLLLLLSGCGGKKTVVGSWEVLSVGEPDMVTCLHFTEDGTGTWEIKYGEPEQSLWMEFLYVVNEDQLTICYQDNSKQQFTVAFEDEKMLLDGEKYYILKPIGE